MYKLDKTIYTVIKDGEEPNWTINEELHKAVFQDMPKDMSSEEKAMFIYCKLCKELTYDEGYLYREKFEDDRYEHTFSQEHLEGLKPGSKVTCFDFSRIFSKMVNDELDPDIEAVLIAEGDNKGHYSTGFHTDKVTVLLEAINGRTGGTNDLMKAKNGFEFEGIKIVSDKEKIIDRAIKKVYPKVFGKEQTSMKKYLLRLRAQPREKVPNNTEVKLQSFIDVMKENNISGNEAIQTLNAFHYFGFFGESLDMCYLGRRENQDGRESFKRMVLMRSKKDLNEKESESRSYYLMDSDTLEWRECREQKIIDNLNSGKFVYEDKNHKMPGIEMEDNNDTISRD